MVCFPNTYVHTLNKKIIFFFASPLSKKTKGAGHQVGEKRTFGGRQKLLADGVAGGSKNRPGVKFGHISCHFSRILNLNQKQKSYANLKLAYSQNSKNTFALRPFGSKMDFPTGFS